MINLYLNKYFVEDLWQDVSCLLVSLFVHRRRLCVFGLGRVLDVGERRGVVVELHVGHHEDAELGCSTQKQTSLHKRIKATLRTSQEPAKSRGECSALPSAYSHGTNVGNPPGLKKTLLLHAEWKAYPEAWQVLKCACPQRQRLCGTLPRNTGP